MSVNHSRQIIQVDVTLDDVVNASIFTRRKLQHVSDTFLQRDQQTRYRNLLCGDISRLVTKRYLEGIGLSVTDWDDVRTDNFRGTRKRFDLMVNDKTIEVASSVMKQPSLSWVLENENIIQPIRVHQKDIVIQVFYSADPLKLNLFGWTESNLLANNTYKAIRNVGGYLRDFWLMPFTDPNAFPMSRVARRLR